MKYTILDKLTALREKLPVRKAGTRLLALLLALVLLQGDLMLPAYSAGETSGETSEQSTATNDSIVPSVPEQAEVELPVDEDTLVITLDGVETSVLELFEYEKVEICAEGLEQQADYQWQIQHPETGAWINIYDATEQCISVSAALVKNMLDEDGTAALRCRAHTEEYAYLTGSIRVTLLEEPEATSVQLFSLDEPDVPLADGDAVPEFVTITIEYILYTYVQQGDDFAEMEISAAFTPYVATLKSKTSLQNRDVPCPIVVGYNPELVKVTEGGTERDPYTGEFHIQDDGTACVLINQTDITADVAYRVEYHPAQVNYDVRYFFQNIYDDLYVEDSSILAEAGIHTYPVVAQGYTGTHPAEMHTEAKFAGFTSLYYEPETIAADGSTEFNVYYERNYCLMEFDCAGGYGTDTIYVRYGTYISVPDPVRSGWNFAGWDLTGAEDSDGNTLILTDSNGNAILYSDDVKNNLPANMPRYNSSYTALWTRSATTFTVVYWVQNANDDAYSYVYSAEGIVGKTGDVVNLSNVTSYSDSAQNALTTELPANNALKGYSTLITDITDGVVSEPYNGEYITVADENGVEQTGVQLQGDGSTIFNIYFKRNEYTLWFVYAREHITNDTIQIATNTTSSSSGYTYKSSSESTPTGKKITDDQIWTTSVQTLPTIAAADVSTNSFTEGSYKYYYISLQARYRQDLDDLWPTSAVNADNSGALKMVGNYRCVGWCANSNSNYADSNYLPNAVITGKYATLDAQILMDPAKTSDEKHILLAHWSRNEYLWEYQFYVGITDDEYKEECNEDPTNTIEYDFTTAHPYWHRWKLVASQTTYSFSNKLSDQPRATLPGIRYTARMQDANDLDGDGSRTDLIYFYYRYEHSLIFNNYGDILLAYETPFEKPTTPGDSSWKFQYVNGVKGEYQSAEGIWNLYESAYAVDYGISLENHVSNADTEIQNAYPSTLEPGAYYFDGWYTGPNGSGEEVDFDDGDERHEDNIWYNPTMPDDDLILFAYWKPVVHSVYFYYDYSDYVAALDPDNTEDHYWYHEENGVKVPDKYPIEVVHGSLVGTTYSNIPEAEEDYSFVGWFYIDETGKKKFAPDSMEVKKDLHLFAEWQSGIDTQYQVTYVLENAYGSYPAGTRIAKPTAGHLTAGKTKTFNAKVGTELLSDFKDLPLFPSVNSHSILMEENSENNTFEFTYVYDDAVYYIVRYIDKITGLPLQEAKIEKSTKAIVTEKFVQFDGYLPDNYYIRKVLAADGDVGAGGGEVTEDDVNELNEIIFYYTPDHTHGLYVIEFYTQVLGGSGEFDDDASWYLEQSELGTANLNDTISVTVNPTKFSGFSYSQSWITSYNEDGNETVTSITATELSGKVTEHGLEIRIYYIRNSYPYTVQYVEYGTDNVLYTDTKTETDAKPYQDTVTVTAPAEYQPGEIKYLFYSTAEKPQEQTMDIRATDTGNVMTFYYRAKTVSIFYEAVCLTAGASDYGEVSLNFESAATTTNISGSEALPGEGFEFVGWYSDEACTNLVGSDLEYKPTTLPDADSVIFYALFEPVLTSMTLTTKVIDITSYDDTFLFMIEGQGKHTYLKMTVAVPANGSVIISEIPIDEYKVTELTGWSWEYSQPSIITASQIKENSTTVDLSKASITFTLIEQDVINSKNKIQFTNSYANSDWLGGECYKDNNFN